MNSEYDFIVVGAGSAGCVVAAQLVRRHAGTVLLIEAGGHDKSIFHVMPAGALQVFQKKSWPYMTVPQKNANGRELLIAQGKVLGGSSAVNGMIYIRGQRQDYDEWAQQWGCLGWSYDDVLPFFKKAESNESLAGEHHGQDGLFKVSENRYRHPLTMAFVRGGQELGLPYVNDFNGASQEGVGFYQTTTFDGTRGSTSRTYLAAVRDNPNIDVVTDALVHKVDIVDGRATGVVFSLKDGAPLTVRARNEVVVSAGAFGSPKVLMLSGVGPRRALEALGIEVKADLPVGKNFHDHLHVSVNALIRGNDSLFGEDKGFKALRHGLQWLLFRTGVLTSNVLEGGAFVDTIGQGRPDVQLHFLPLLDNFDNTPGEKAAADGHGISIKVGHLQPRSRGEVRLRSADPQDLVVIDANFLDDPEDLAGHVRAVQLGLKMLRTPALKALIKEVTVPANIDIDDIPALEAFVRRDIKTVYHPGGTCRMGTDPASSVTDLSLRVHGVANLRVIDLSVCPQVPSGNTNAVAVMIGERGAQFILDAQVPSLPVTRIGLVQNSATAIKVLP